MVAAKHSLFEVEVPLERMGAVVELFTSEIRVDTQQLQKGCTRILRGDRDINRHSITANTMKQ